MRESPQLRSLRKQHRHAMKMEHLYPGRGWGKKVAQYNAAIMIALAKGNPAR